MKTAILILGVLVMLFLPVVGLGAVVEIPYFVVCGWIHYLFNVLPKIHVNVGMILSGLAAFVMAVVGLHLVLRWFWSQRTREHAWHWNWTVCISLLIPVLFAITIAAGGLVHQGSWLMQESPWIEEIRGARSSKNISNARQIAISLRIWSADHSGKYPERLQQLLTDGALIDNSILYYTSVEGGTPELFEYLPGLADSDSASLPIVVAPRAEIRGKWRVMAFNDGSVTTVKPEDFAKAMLEWKQRVAASQAKP